ncbi:MAG: hypothetical protein ACRDOK_01670 [Streptosporangiaceae bacterium]
MRVGRRLGRRWWVSMSPLGWLLWQLLKYAILAAIWAAGFIREKINARSTSPAV